jgi:ribosomal protein S18 acetylase RimI-like enzyme
MTITIRTPKTKSDFISVANLAHQLAEYHHEDQRPDPRKLKADTDWYSSRLISINGVDAGFVGWHKLYACQSAERGIELQNIFVDQKYRGHNLGFQLVLEVIRDALKLKCAEIKIGLRKENTVALEFYKKLGCSITDRNDSWRCKLKRSQMIDIIENLERGTRKAVSR